MRPPGPKARWIWLPPIVAIAAVGIYRIETTGDPSGSSPPVTARVSGIPETVFDWSSQACAPDELPDLPVHAFRDYRGQVELILPHFNSWRMVGPSLNVVRPTCQVVMGSSLDQNPADFNDREWLASIYTRDGRHIAALVHDEYHGVPSQTCAYQVPTSCWYNAITAASSSDGGRSFVQPLPPGQLVAGSQLRYRPGLEPDGLFSPSNIVRGPGGYYYAMAQLHTPAGIEGTCLMRTRDPWSAPSWRAWGGTGFGLRFLDPYRAVGAAPRPCAPIATRRIASMHESLTDSTYLHRFVLVGLASAPGPGGGLVNGVYFSTSADLIHWTKRKLLMRATRVQGFRCGGRAPIAYPSLLDPRSRSRDFSTIGRRPYLYFTRFNFPGCKPSLDRDLVRVRVDFRR